MTGQIAQYLIIIIGNYILVGLELLFHHIFDTTRRKVKWMCIPPLAYIIMFYNVFMIFKEIYWNEIEWKE